MKYYNSLKNFLNNYDKDIVHFTTCNSGGAQLAKNLAKSCKKNNIDLAFFAPDQNSLKVMVNNTTTIKNVDDNEFRLDICKNIPSDHVLFGTEKFRSVAWMRYEILKAILSSGRLAIYLDTDIVVRKNYEEEVLDIFDSKNCFDGAIQTNHVGKACTGFFAFHPNAKEKIMKIYSEKFLSHNNYKQFGGDGKISDQAYFNSIVCPLNSKKLLNMKLLSKELYPNGHYWYNHSRELNKSCKIIHYNCIKGQEKKVSKMMEYGDWLII